MGCTIGGFFDRIEALSPGCARFAAEVGQDLGSRPARQAMM